MSGNDEEPSDGSPPVEAPNAATPTAAPGTPVASGPAPNVPVLPESSTKSAVGWCVERCRQVARQGWKFGGDVCRYYWGMREALWEFIAGHAPDMMSESIRMREVRLVPYESHPLAEFNADGWTVAVPKRCVVCGEPTSNPPIDAHLSIDDAARAFWVPVGTAIAGAALGLVLWDRRYLLLAIVLGPVLGYALRGKVAVRMRVARCDQHATRTRIPQVLAWGNTLVLRFGHKMLRKIFLYGEPMHSAASPAQTSSSGPALPGADQSGAYQPGTYTGSEQAASTYTPETIPLAESPAPENATIRHDRPPVFDQDADSPSPLVP